MNLKYFYIFLFMKIFTNY